jgi:malonate-semialdehyde dehydrogenase (acetylating) / methylmalonate-semialdehyde dehydrogenase
MYRLVATRGVSASAVRSVSRKLPLSAPAATISPRMASAATAARRIAATGQHLRPYSALASTATSFPQTHEKIAQPEDTPWFVDNEFKASSADKWIDLHDPATNNLVTRVPQSTDAELQAAVDSAQKAFPEWRAKSVLARQQIMFKFTSLVHENWDRLAASITLEQGKTFADAKGDVLRGLQVAEAACGAPELLKGEVLEVAKDMETRTYREPLGVTAAICPFSK